MCLLYLFVFLLRRLQCFVSVYNHLSLTYSFLFVMNHCWYPLFPLLLFHKSLKGRISNVEPSQVPHWLTCMLEYQLTPISFSFPGQWTNVTLSLSLSRSWLIYKVIVIYISLSFFAYYISRFYFDLHSRELICFSICSTVTQEKWPGDKKLLPVLVQQWLTCSFSAINPTFIFPSCWQHRHHIESEARS